MADSGGWEETFYALVLTMNGSSKILVKRAYHSFAQGPYTAHYGDDHDHTGYTIAEGTVRPDPDSIGVLVVEIVTCASMVEDHQKCTSSNRSASSSRSLMEDLQGGRLDLLQLRGGSSTNFTVPDHSPNTWQSLGMLLENFWFW